MSRYESREDQEKDPRKKHGFRPEMDSAATMTTEEALLCFDSMQLALNSICLEFTVERPGSVAAVAIFRRHDIDVLRMELARKTLKKALADNGYRVPE